MSSQDTALWLQEQLPQSPNTAIILGTGLSNMAESFKVIKILPYHKIPGFVKTTAPSHKGNLILAEIRGKAVLFMQGRFHYYEGHPMPKVIFPIQVLAALGIQTLILTNASGSLRPELAPGSIVQITDHINFMGINPLVGVNNDALGERFPSLNEPYDPQYGKICDDIAHKLGIPTQKGIYIAVSGPSLETKAECAAFATWGADLVGMSTVPEVIVARHAGIRVLAYSIVTNYSNLFHSDAHSQEEIRHHASIASEQLKLLLSEFIKDL